MLKNYLKIAWRNLVKNSGYSLINIIGLAIGLSCFILIVAYIQYEFSYDRFNKKADRIYRVIQQQPDNFYMGTNYFAITPAALEDAMQTDLSEVERATTIGNQNLSLQVKSEAFREKGIIATPTLFDVFTFPMRKGNPKTALTSINSIVLTQALAEKMFGEEDAIGKNITQKDGTLLTVTGVIENVPENAHFNFSFIVPATTNEYFAQNTTNWRNSGWYTYILLNENVDSDKFQEKLPAFISTHSPTNYSYFLQPLTDIHLRSDLNLELSANSNIMYIYLLGGIALLVLLLAVVNYINLAVAQSIKRTKEIGLRKVLGSQRSQLIIQFLFEAMISAFLAVLLALFIVDLAFPLFSNLVQRPLDFSYLLTLQFTGILFVCLLLVGCISGSYPALIATRMQPREAVMGDASKPLSRSYFQNALIVGQFMASIVLVIGSLVIYQQYKYIQDKEMGYEREHILTVPVIDEDITRQYDVIRQELLKNPQIRSVATSDVLPNNIESSTVLRNWEGSSDPEREQQVYITGAGYNFTELYGLDIVRGRNFSPEISSDTTQGAYLLNETAVNALGWNLDNAVGKRMSTWGGEGNVVGVIKDFHMHSLHMAIQPLTVYLEPSRFRYLSIKMDGQNISETVDYAKNTIAAFSPYPFTYSFLDEVFDQQYKADMRLGKAVGYLTILAFFIAVLGLLGLSAFATEKRTKEIGIRKVLGASIANIVQLLSKDFIKLVALGFLIAVPIAWYAMTQWLADFAYRIEIGAGIFLLAGGLALLIALATVSWQSICAALANPVDSLRSE